MKRFHRRGLALTEWSILLGMLGIGLFWFVGSTGDDVRTDLGKTSNNFLNPASLVDRYNGNSGSSSTSQSSGEASSSSASNGSSSSSSGGGTSNNGSGSGGRGNRRRGR